MPVFKNPDLRKKLKRAQRRFNKSNKGGFFKACKKGGKINPETPFEINYSHTFNFKKKFRNKGNKEKMVELLRLANIRIPFNPQPYAKRRSKKHGFKKRKGCFVCGSIATCQHHLIQLQHGGYDNGVNRIPICNECHAEIHPWLKEDE